jgi:hypothetical protein
MRPDIQEIINFGILRQYAKLNNVDYQGNKNTIIDNIVLAVRNGTLEEEKVRLFIQEQLWYGKNKHTYFIEISSELVSRFKDRDTLLEFFRNRGIQPFNNLDRINNPAGVPLACFWYESNPLDDSIVNKVYLGYIETNYTYRYEGQVIVFSPVNTYICIEVDLKRNLLVLRVRSRSGVKPTQDVNAQNINTNSLAKKYLDRLREDFGFTYLDGASEEIKNTMYNIEKALTSFIELQFQPKVSENHEFINSFIDEVAARLEIVDVKTPINLYDRIAGLLERALIIQNAEVIESYVDGKKGYINMFDFRDDRGGRISARSKHNSTPIQASDIFFDTRETINDVKLIDILSAVWFKPVDASGIQENDEYSLGLIDEFDDDECDSDTDDVVDQGDKKVLRIKTKMIAFRGFYKIEFKRYLLKEEYNHVLSLIDSFKGL